MATQICIVSERLVANLIPALMLRPERVLLVSSTEMEGQGLTHRLGELLASEGLVVEVKTGLPSGGLSDIAAYASALRKDLEASGPEDALILNLTGGNKLMTIAFSQVLGPVVDRTIYVDTARGLLEELPGGDQAGGSVALAGVIKVPLYLRAQGLRPRKVRSAEPGWEEGVRARRDLTRFLGRKAAQLSSFFGAINRLASVAQDGRGEALVAPRQQFTGVPRGLWAQALGRIRAAGMVHWADGSSELELLDLEGARYLNGGWLEEYAWLVAQELRPDDLALGVEGDWEGTERGSNELDLVVVHANRLLLIECKTLRLGRDDGSDRDLLYKLDSVGDHVRGLFGEVVLLSAQAPGPLIQDRAAHHRIQVVGPAHLANLQRAIRDWMAQGRFSTPDPLKASHPA